jgi:antitoxin (DNA-binding transcriptional repressor) of toxin-antitoxin stability system
MRTVNIAALKNDLSRYLKVVRGGEEVLIRDRKTPIAKLVPLVQAGEIESEELALAAEGKLRLPEAPLPDWFWSTPGPRVSSRRLHAALQAERDDE